LPTVVTGNGGRGTAVGFANVQMIIGGFVTTAEFVVFGRFAGFDAVLGQDWLRYHACVLEMGTGRVIIKTENMIFVLKSIATKNKSAAYNITLIPPTSRTCPSLDTLEEDGELEEDAIPTAISGNAFARLFNFMQPKCKATVPKIEQAYLCLTYVSSDVTYESVPGADDIIKDIKPIVPEEPTVGLGIYSANEQRLATLLKKIEGQFGEQAPSAETRPTATTSCIQTYPLAPIPNKPLRIYNPGENKEIKTQVDNILKQKITKSSTSPYGPPILMIKKKTGGWRMYLYYRAINAITKRNVFPLPRIEDLFDRLQGVTHFSSLDLARGYYQMGGHP
jgi:hypothetical protein